jgi:hypothetical protein
MLGVAVPTCFWKFGPRAKQGMRPLLAPEVRPCSVCGEVVLEVGRIAVNIFDALPPHKAALLYSRPICATCHDATLTVAASYMRPSQQSRRENGANRRLCLSASNDAAFRENRHRWGGRTGVALTKEPRALSPRNLVRENGDPRSNPAIIHPRFAACYKL